jgi:hypothetical protein
MPKTIIYKICCKDTNISDFYIGHTNDLKKKKYHHKSSYNNEKSKIYNCKVYQFMRENGGWNNFEFIQIECFNCINAIEARARERYHIGLLKPSLNYDKTFISS